MTVNIDNLKEEKIKFNDILRSLEYCVIKIQYENKKLTKTKEITEEEREMREKFLKRNMSEILYSILNSCFTNPFAPYFKAGKYDLQDRIKYSCDITDFAERTIDRIFYEANLYIINGLEKIDRKIERKKSDLQS